MKVKIGFIGTGRIAVRHMKKLAKIKDTELACVCDVDGKEAQKVAKAFGTKSYVEYQEMLDKEKLQAVYICLPPFAHGDQEILAAEKGINLFVEKPLALNLEKAYQINEVIEKNGVISSVGYVYRYSDIVNRAKKELKKRKIALVLGHYFCPLRHDVPWWRNKNESGGQIVEQTTHIFDLARYLVGEVDKVYGQKFNGLMEDMENYSLDDASCVNLHFENGAIGSISSACILSHGREWEINLIAKGLKVDLLLSSRLLKINNGKEKKIRMDIDPYQAENEAFIKAIKEDNPKIISSPYSDALKTLKLTLAANASLEKEEMIKLK
ncbi:Gfo/Idh/MocA family oxidoreductase [Candidatus Aerophobetes bacterium]|uniref:Gfo/Idh/MocA family oxidoreductase n=1 Tax=Aerophobetes bacterium TaxID=2030807 RepID=A0A523S1M7_UNCAE|nr:MAG: Gfo/Idh/MocA family oxidoreductase [Candidatus Aerophobetes bacterium]